MKENNLYKKYQELNKPPQSKAAISLFFWILFITIVIIFVRVSSPKQTLNKKEVNNKINNYAYTYYDNTDIIYGKTYNGKHIFTLSNHKYYFNSKKVYEIKNHQLTEIPFDINYLKITPAMIDNLTKDNNIKENDNQIYTVPLSNFINLFDKDVPVNSQELDKYNIIINKYFKENKLYMIKIDLSSYYEYKQTENKGILNIELYEENTINDFTKEYDEMIGVIKWPYHF